MRPASLKEVSRKQCFEICRLRRRNPVSGMNFKNTLPYSVFCQKAPSFSRFGCLEGAFAWGKSHTFDFIGCAAASCAWIRAVKPGMVLRAGVSGPRRASALSGLGAFRAPALSGSGVLRLGCFLMLALTARSGSVLQRGGQARRAFCKALRVPGSSGASLVREGRAFCALCRFRCRRALLPPAASGAWVRAVKPRDGSARWGDLVAAEGLFAKNFEKFKKFFQKRLYKCESTRYNNNSNHY